MIEENLTGLEALSKNVNVENSDLKKVVEESEKLLNQNEYSVNQSANGENQQQIQIIRRD